MVDKDVPEWKIKSCDNCEREYLKGTGITKIWLMGEDKYEDFPDWRYIRFDDTEGLEKFQGKSYAILCFCTDKCLNEYLCKNAELNKNDNPK